MDSAGQDQPCGHRNRRFTKFLLGPASRPIAIGWSPLHAYGTPLTSTLTLTTDINEILESVTELEGVSDAVQQ